MKHWADWWDSEPEYGSDWSDDFKTFVRLREINKELAAFEAKRDELRYSTADADSLEKVESRIEKLRAEREAILRDKNQTKRRRTERDRLNDELRDAVREIMQEQYDRGDKVNRRKACEAFLRSDRPEHRQLRREACRDWDDPEGTLYKVTHGVSIEKSRTS